MTGWKNILILTLKKEQMPLIVLKKKLNWLLIVSMAKEWKIYEKESMSG